MIDIVNNSVQKIQKSGVPYFEVGTWKEINEHLASLNLNYQTQGKKFPLIFLLSDSLRGRSTDPDTDIRESSPSIYIFGVAVPNERTLWRHENEMPKLKALRAEFIESFKSYADLLDISTDDEYIFDNTLLNKLTMNVNAIHLELNAEYEINEC